MTDFSDPKAEIFSHMPTRLERFHLNADLEAERCALGDFCVGPHRGAPEVMESLADSWRRSLGSDNSELAYHSRDAIDRAEYEASERQIIFTRILDLHRRQSNLSESGIRTLLQATATGLREKRNLFSRRELLTALGGTSSLKAAQQLTKMYDNLFVARSSEITADKGASYTVAVQDIARMVSYVDYLESLDALDEMMQGA